MKGERRGRDWTARCPACGVLVGTRYPEGSEHRVFNLHGMGKESCASSGQRVTEGPRWQQLLDLAVTLIGHDKVGVYDPRKDYLVPYPAEETEEPESWRGRIVL